VAIRTSTSEITTDMWIAQERKASTLLILGGNEERRLEMELNN